MPRRSAEALWQDLRALRAAPPGLAATDAARRAVFAASLRQAQELSAAADVSGYATKPLPLFYSLSQGLRAVCAVQIEDDNWRLRGHGAQVTTHASILSTVVKPNPSRSKDGNPEPTQDALSALHAAEKAPSLTKPATLGAIWKADPAMPKLPDGLDDSPGPLTLHLPPYDLAEAHGEAGYIELSVQGLSVHLSDAEMADALKAYPTLVGGTAPRQADGSSDARWYVVRGDQVTYRADVRALDLSSFRPWLLTSPVLRWQLEEAGPAAHLEAFDRLGPTKIDQQPKQRLVFPALGGSKVLAFPALTWLGLLALSSLARYEPSSWTEAIDPDQSLLAVPLEQACDRAAEWVPRVLKTMLAGDASD